MEQLYHTTQLIGIKDKNITLNKVLKHKTHIEMIATLDYAPGNCNHCQGKQIKYDFQKPSKIPFLEVAGFPSLIRLKKRRFQCKNCRKVTVSETSLVQKNCQISEPLRQKVAQALVNRQALTHIAQDLAISTSTVHRKLKKFTFKKSYPSMSFRIKKESLPSLHRILRPRKSSPSLRIGHKQLFAIISSGILKRLGTA